MAGTKEGMARAGVERFLRGDFDAVARDLHPEVEWINAPDAVEPGIRRGIPAFLEALRAINEPFEWMAVDFEEVRERGDELLVFLRSVGVARGSRLRVEQRFVWRYRFREEKIAQLEWAIDTPEARERLGVSAGHPNVERFMQIMDAFDRLAEAGRAAAGEAVPSMLEAIDPEVVLEPRQSALQGSYVGHEGVLAWLSDLQEHYRGGRLELAEIRPFNDSVLATGSLHVAAGSGIATEAEVAIVARFRDGLMTRFTDYGDRDLAAAGLRS